VTRAQRLFGPRYARRRDALDKTAELDVNPIAKKLASDLGQDAETAERNAQHIAQILRCTLKRRKARQTSNTSHTKPAT